MHSSNAAESPLPHMLPWPILGNRAFVEPWHWISQPGCPGNFFFPPISDFMLVQEIRVALASFHCTPGSYKTLRNFTFSVPAFGRTCRKQHKPFIPHRHRWTTCGLLLSLVFSGALMARRKSQGFNQYTLFQKGSWMPRYQWEWSAI